VTHAMTSAVRVRHLHLRAPDDDLVARGRVLIADALRTASLPGSAGQHLVVRRLALGRIDPASSPATVALQIEAALGVAAMTAVPFDDSAASDATAVTFPDRLAARMELVRHLARRRVPTEWFWPLAVRGWRSSMPRDEALRLILAGRDAGEPGETYRTAQLVDSLCRSGDASAALGVLQRVDGPVLLARLGVVAPTASASTGSDARTHTWLATLPSYWRTVVTEWAARWGASDARTLWLAVLAMVATHPARDVEMLVPRAARLIDELSSARRTTTRPLSAKPASSRSDGPEPHPVAQPRTASPPLGRPEGLSPSSASAIPQRERETATAPGETPPADEAAPGEWHGLLRTSDWAGLLFLIAAMKRLRLPLFIDESDEPHPLAVLLLACDWLQVPRDDVIREALAPSHPERAERATTRSRRATTELRTLRRWLRRRPRLTLDELANRHGHLAVSRTHVDVWLPPETVDLRIRRWGLDLDPGWVPWLGRIVTFHYAPPPCS
jgi:hypothetical protein